MKILAHRGSAHNVQENTLDAFDAARALGADGVELDVRSTADGVLVVHHDPEIAGAGRIAALEREALPDYVPTLAEALDTLSGLEVNVEVKHSPGEAGYGPDEALADAVAQLLSARNDKAAVVVSSFSLATLDAHLAAAPEIETAWLLAPGSGVLEACAIAVAHGHRGVHPWHELLTARVLEGARANGLTMRAWTVDDPARVVELAGLGVGAVITNDVAAAASAIATLGPR